VPCRSRSLTFVAGLGGGRVAAGERTRPMRFMIMHKLTPTLEAGV